MTLNNKQNKVCVITGGGSGIGLATAKIMGQNHSIVISGRTVSKLDAAIAELKSIGIEANAIPCDVSNYESVVNLAKEASSAGKITAVIHAAGISPNMGSVETILKVNALGTVHIHDVFYNHLPEGACLIDVASIGGHVAPNIILPVRAYRHCYKNLDRFYNKLAARVKIVPPALRSGFAYAISKNFMIWYVKSDAARYGEKGIRVLSVSPGSFETKMGEIEREAAEKFVKHCAIKRFGRAEEIAQLLAFCIDERLGYLTGVDIICDGGCLAAYKRSPLSKLGIVL